MHSNLIVLASLCLIATRVLAQAPKDAAADPLRDLIDGDQLRVTVPGLFENDKPSVLIRQIGHGGKIFLPFAGDIEIAGMPIRLAQREIAKAYFQQRGLAHSEIKVELLKVHDPSITGDLIKYGDWLSIRIWRAMPAKETRYVLRVGGDGNIRYPDAGLLYVANRPWSGGEDAVTDDLKKRGLLTEEPLTLEPITDADAEAEPATVRVGSLAPATQPAPRTAADPRTLWHDAQDKLLALPWIREPRGSIFLNEASAISHHYSATGRVEDILEQAAPVLQPRVIWETTLPDGFYQLDATAATKAELFLRLTIAYEQAFGCTITRERREIPVLLIQADQAVANKALRETPAILKKMSRGPVDSDHDFLNCEGSISYFCETLEKKLQMPVVDETALTKSYDIKVTYASKSPIASLDDSLRTQGLSATKSRRTIEVVVVKAKADTARQ